MALNSLGLNPTDQEVVDIPVKIARKGLIYFPDFCMICLRYLKKDEDEQFHHWMFKVPTHTKTIFTKQSVFSICLEFHLRRVLNVMVMYQNRCYVARNLTR